LVYKGSKLNESFLKYINFIATRRSIVDSISDVLKGETDSLKKSKLKSEIEVLDKQVKAKQSSILKEEPRSLLSLIIRWSLDVEIPEFSDRSKDERDQIIFNYYRDHFFDHADFKDDRSIRLPLVFPKIDQYIQRLTMQHPDSINLALDYVLQKCVPESELFKFLLSHYLNLYANSKYVGMDGVYVHLVEAYYAAGKAPWIDRENLAKMVSDAKSLKPLLIDRVAPDIRVFTKDSSPITIHSIESQFLVLFFWAPDCGHCKKSLPYITEFYNNFKSKGVEILAICTKLGPEAKTCWETIDSLHLTHWINASDPSHSSRFKLIYDLKTTPQIYILDRRKKILTKKIGAEQLSEVMDKLLKINENE
jgi:thiol-disulfide isomerase/thioredoxin